MVSYDILSQLKSLVGYEVEFSDDQAIEEGMIKRFAEAIGDDNPLYHDREFAQKSPFRGIIAPPTFVFEWNHHEVLTVDEDGAHLAGVALPRQSVRAGNEYEFIQPLRPGDIITTKSRVAEVYEKQGRSGTMTFVVCESTYTNQENRLLGIQRSSLIVLTQQG